RKLTDEDLVLLVCASISQFDSAEPIIEKASELARSAGLRDIDQQKARELLALPRDDLFRAIAARTEAFARCGNSLIDEWADTFPDERRLSRTRALPLLFLPAESRKQPPRQQYVQKILQFFEKRAGNVAQRGPLSRLLIGKTTPRLDLLELRSRLLPAENILQ